MLSRRRDSDRGGVDHGFTLIELLVTVVIIGTIAASLAGVVISYLKHTVDTRSRITESLELQFVTAYWQRDVASVGVRSLDFGDDDGDEDDDEEDEDDDEQTFPLERSVNLAPCSAAASLTQVITLGWTEYSDPTLEVDDPDGRQLVKVTYGTRGPSNDLELVRVRCGSQPQEVVVAEHLSGVSVVCEGGGVSGCNDATGAVPARIRMTLSVRDPEGQGDTGIVNQTIQGERRQS